MSLPSPDPAALQTSHRLTELIGAEIAASAGWISFARYMELALYAPGLGYYAAGSRKFGAAGDFVTAPEISPLFAQAMARQIAEVLDQSSPTITEIGAGTGILAADLLIALEALGTLPTRYCILELSADLADRQRKTLTARAPHLADRVEWLSELPETISGVVLGNEVLDAMPAHLLLFDGSQTMERGVALAGDGGLIFEDRPASGAIAQQAATIEEFCKSATPYLTEVSLANRAWVGELARRLTKGALLLIDYGFPRHEYYHPQRVGGTLMCHYRHHAHTDPFYLPGLQDITVHVDFTTVAEAAFDAGLSVAGFTSQSHFLLNCGLFDLLARDDDAVRRLRANVAVNTLISPAEMGELFKVIALSRGISEPLLGFTRGDRTHAL